MSHYRLHRKATIYTRHGDRGETGLFSGQRLPKSHVVFEALGDLDELNAKLGAVRLGLLEDDSDAEFENMVREIQSRLIDIGSSVATPRNATKSKTKLERTAFEQEHVDQLEVFIDRLESELPKLTAFILPSGGKRAVAFHEARTICRRAERHLIAVDVAFEQEDTVKRYVNRLSDLLFLCGRYYSRKDGHPEHIYRKQRRKCARSQETEVDV